MKIVGPIIDLSYKTSTKKKQLLVAYGGTEAAGWYKIGKDSNYPYTFSKLIVEQVDTRKYYKVIFAGNEKIMEDLNRRYGNKKFEFRILPHDQWLKEISNSEDVLINPGLEAPLEAIAYERPVFFLPPYNSSAYVELDEFIVNGIATKENSIHFADYFPHSNYAGRNLRVIMSEFLAELKRFENSPEILEDCAKRISNYLNMPIEKKNMQIKKQKQYIKALGGNGLDETVHIIEKFLNSKNKNGK